MADFIERAVLALKIAKLAAAPEAKHAELQPLALGTLIDLKKDADPIGLAVYHARLNGRPEPWAAFNSGGPGNPPPAVDLLHAPLNEAAGELFATFKAWIGPGQMHELFVNGKLPENVVTEATKELMQEAIEGAKETLATVLKWVAGAAVVGGVGFVLYKAATAKPKRRALPVDDDDDDPLLLRRRRLSQLTHFDLLDQE